MTENDALKELRLQSQVLEQRIFCNREIEEFVSSVLLEHRKNAVDIGIKALEEIQAYREIGTVEELQALKEKNEPKKVIGIRANLQNRYCPSCNEWMTFEIKKGMQYCPNCGQKLDWSNTTKTEGYADQSGLMPAT